MLSEELTQAAGTTSPQALGPGIVPLPVIEGYEVVSLLGRGGMGRVFLARHRVLGRNVAIKMLIDASEEMLVARFHAESQAVAHLQHPNIAQVFETGQIDGQPFLVLEYVDGGSLTQKLAGKPQPFLDAARVVEILARAIEHSHHNGILHRDLKPANILLTADGNPKITDFGLAKRLHEDSKLTRTGEILGTPSYMAPEQASGVTTNIGPAVDIYALGAILYEMLTGRPPFQGPDTMQTLMMVLTMEPVSPSRLLPKLSRDLETICLKCLEKSPRKRYASAAALADDLQRFLDGRPILARPVRLWEQALKWSKRRPAAAAFLVLLFASVVGLGVGFVQIQSANDQLEESAGKLRATNSQLEASNQQTEAANVQLKQSIRDTEASLTVGREAIDRMLVRLSEQLAPLPQSDRLRQESLEDARKLYEKMTAIRPRDRAGISTAADALGKLGSIYHNLGRLDDAEATYRKAVAIHTDLKTQEPASADHRRGCANMLLNLANLELTRGKRDEAESLVRAALSEIEPLLDGADSATLRSASGMYNTLALTLQTKAREENKKPEDSMKAHQAALKMRKQWLAKEPDSNDAKIAVASSLSNRALLQMEDHPEKAAAAFFEAEKLVAGQTSPEQRFFLGQFQVNRAVAYEYLKKDKDTEATHAAALVTLSALVADYSAVPKYQYSLAKEHLTFAQFCGPRLRTEEGLRHARIAGAILDRLIKENPKDQRFRTELARWRWLTNLFEEDLAKAKKKKS